MRLPEIETANLCLVPQTRDEILAYIERLASEEKANVSPMWRAQVERSSLCDPWIHGFVALSKANRAEAGQCGFKGPPGPDGSVEIAYAILPGHQGKGYASEAVAALVDFAFGSGQVRAVRAHTLPEHNASTRVLTKNGFRCLGEVLDPEDGAVWRWEKCAGTVRTNGSP